jgi:hypothetical protein
MKADVTGGTKRSNNTHSQDTTIHTSVAISKARSIRRHNGLRAREDDFSMTGIRAGRLEENIAGSMRNAAHRGNRLRRLQ